MDAVQLLAVFMMLKQRFMLLLLEYRTVLYSLQLVLRVDEAKTFFFCHGLLLRELMHMGKKTSSAD